MSRGDAMLSFVSCVRLLTHQKLEYTVRSSIRSEVHAATALVTAVLSARSQRQGGLPSCCLQMLRRVTAGDRCALQTRA